MHIHNDNFILIKSAYTEQSSLGKQELKFTVTLAYHGYLRSMNSLMKNMKVVKSLFIEIIKFKVSNAWSMLS